METGNTLAEINEANRELAQQCTAVARRTRFAGPTRHRQEGDPCPLFTNFLVLQ
jgi:hypothetical protein